jgi:predicted PilT family ATPase
LLRAAVRATLASIAGECAVDVQEVRKLDAYLKRLFGNPRIRVVPRESDSANVFVGEENVGKLVLDDDDDDDDRSYNFEMKITLDDASAKAPDIKKLDTYLKRKFESERVRVVPRLKKKDSAEVYVGEEYIGVLFFDEKDARSSFFELPILAVDLDEPDLPKD